MKTYRPFCSVSALLAGALCSIWPLLGYAEPVLKPTQQNAEEWLEPSLKLAQEFGLKFDLPPIAAPTDEPPAVAGPLVRRIIYRGQQAVPTATLEALAAPYLNRSLGPADLEALRQAVTRHYIELGYVNSGAVFAADAVNGDTLTLDIVEGRIASLRLKGLERLHEDYIVQRLVHDENEALNVERLRERFQQLLADPLFERMNARLTPGARLGEATLDVDVTRARPYFFNLAVNNYRPPSIGETALNVLGGVRNLTGAGDVLEASVQYADGEIGRSNISWQMPLNQRGTRFSLQLDRGRSSVIEEPMRGLDIESTLASNDVGLSHVLRESLHERLAIGVHRVWRENRTKLLGQPFSFVPGEPDGITRTRAWRFWQEYSQRSEQDALALRSSFSWVRNNLQTIAGAPLVSTQPAQHTLNWLGQVQYARQIHAEGTQLLLRGTLQAAQEPLLALDQLALGGVSTVRGYRENQMLRDTGAVLNIEVDHPLVRNAGAGWNLSLIPFYDIGHGRNHQAAGDTISSIGLALRNRWQGTSLDVAVAHRLAYPEAVNGVRGSLQDQAIHMQFGYQF